MRNVGILGAYGIVYCTVMRVSSKERIYSGRVL